MTLIEQLTDKINRNPEQAVIMADLKILLTEAQELGEWIQTSNKVLTSRLQRLQRKADATYMGGSNELEFRERIQKLEKELENMRVIFSRMQNRLR
jgi:hypothetical protein